MTSDIKPHWLTMSEAKLHTHLTEVLKLPAPLVADAVTRVRDFKEQQRRAKLKTSAIHQAWDDLLFAARSELARVRTMKSQASAASEANNGFSGYRLKYEALAAYDTVLAGVIEKLRRVQKADEQTPLQFAEMLRKAGKMPTPGLGNHWTDYVKDAERKRVEQLFNDLPNPARGKRKTPFERSISPREHDRAKKLVVGRLCAEQGTAEREYEVTTDPDEKARLGKLIKEMQLAQYKLDSLPRTSPVPKTWRDIVPKKKGVGEDDEELGES